jgi:5'-nucleotidase
MNERRRVLITNDDGIAAPGLRRLAEAAVANGLDVVVAAPLTEASGSGAAMGAYTSDGRVIIERTTLDGLADVAAYGVAASPSYVVVLAMLSSFGQPPDLVLSGINLGANAGRAVLHSGTVGAALTAAAQGRPAMAVSLDVLSPLGNDDPAPGPTADELDDDADDDETVRLAAADHEDRNWATATGLVSRLLPMLAEAPDGTVLNLNVPDLPPDRIRGLRRARLARFGQVQMAIAETGEDFVRTSVEQSRFRHEPGTDLAWLAEGYATLTAIRPMTEVHDFQVPEWAEWAPPVSTRSWKPTAK